LDTKKFDKNLLDSSTFWNVDMTLPDSKKDKDIINVGVLYGGMDSKTPHIESAYSLPEIISALENTKGVSKKKSSFIKPFRFESGRRRAKVVAFGTDATGLLFRLLSCRRY